MRFLLLFLVGVTLFAADDVLTPDVVKLITKATDDVTEIEAKALASKATVLDALIPKLVKAQDSATKAGKLEASLAIKAKVDEYRKQLADLSAQRPVVKRVSTSKDVTLYALPGFKGPTVTIKQFDVVIDVQSAGFPNDALRSLRLPAGYTFVVYAAERAGGAAYEIDEESADLTGTPALGMSSFMIKRNK